jgi:hypothetical protein
MITINREDKDANFTRIAAASICSGLCYTPK